MVGEKLTIFFVTINKYTIKKESKIFGFIKKKQGPKPDHVEAIAKMHWPPKPSCLSKEQLKVVCDRFN